MVIIKRIAYGYNSALEDQGLDAYFIDALVQEGSDLIVDIHQAYKTKKMFLEAVEAIVPMLNGEEETYE